MCAYLECDWARVVVGQSQDLRNFLGEGSYMLSVKAVAWAMAWRTSKAQFLGGQINRHGGGRDGGMMSLLLDYVVRLWALEVETDL